MAAARVAYRNRVRDLIVFECDADFNCAPQNVAAATLQGVTLGYALSPRRDAPSTASVDLQRPQDDATATCCRDARAGTARSPSMHPLGPVQLGAELIASSVRYDDAANTRRMGGYAHRSI